jgi:DnaJ like chaperone protein
MSIWTRITDAIAALARGESLAALFEGFASPPERSVAFTIAVIALGAKMAKADGLVTRDEVAAFRRVFQIAPSEAENAARVFNLARQDVAGYESYAARIGTLLKEERQLRIDLMEGLFHIAVADGSFHPGEEQFLQRVADLLGLDKGCFAALKARHVPADAADPYAILGIDPGASYDEARSAWRQLVKEMHPDGMLSRGVPPEAVQLAEDRLSTINQAWDTIQRNRAA